MMWLSRFPSSAALSVSLLIVVLLPHTGHGLASPRPGQNNSPQHATAQFDSPAQQLPWQQLAQTLLQLKAQGMPDQVLLSSRFGLPNLCRTMVGPSGISETAGRGLFATMDAQPGDMLTCYPGDVLMEMGYKDGTIKLKPIVGMDDNLQGRDWTQLIPYILQVTEDFCLMGLPELDQDPAYLGHFANDAAKPATLMKADLERYEQESNQMCNALHQPLENLHMVTMATKPIRKGEEILVSYGHEYWLCLASAQQNDKERP